MKISDCIFAFAVVAVAMACEPARAQPADQPSPPPRPGNFLEYIEGVHLGGAAEEGTPELAWTQLEKFAEIKYEQDYLTDTESWSVNAVAMFPDVLGDRSYNDGGLRVGLYPIIGLQRTYKETNGTASKDVQDLRFGLTGSLRLVGDHWNQIITPAIAWETDLDFDSSVYIASLSWRPVSSDAHNCTQNAPGQGRGDRLACLLRVVVDHQEISDPGDKPALQTASSFTRAGIDVGVAYNLSPREDWGDIVLALQYQRRESFNDNNIGDADRFVAELSLTPTKTSPFKVSLQYTNGEDLSSLDSERSLKVTFGARF